MREAARLLLACGLLALVLAMVHVVWASRGDACRGLAAARGTLSLANSTLANVQETISAPLRPLSSLVARRLSADVLEPTVSLASLVTAAAANRAPLRTARIARIATRLLALAVSLSDACASVLFAVLEGAEGATLRLTAPAARLLAEMDDTCAPPPPCPQPAQDAAPPPHETMRPTERKTAWL